MSGTRAYVATTWTGLRQIVVEQGLPTPPTPAHAVTDALRSGYPEGTQDDWEYAALSAASLACLDLLDDGEPRRRVVVAVDVASLAPGGNNDPTAVVITDPVPWSGVAAVHRSAAGARPGLVHDPGGRVAGADLARLERI